MIGLLVLRHGNNFDPGDRVLRMGSRTDLPLSSSGRAQAAEWARACAGDRTWSPRVIYHSSLRRTQETATIIAEGYETLGRSRPPCRLRHAFDEADYGEDDGRPEEEVRARLGDALLRWETEAVVPEGWSLDPEAVALMWRDFGRELWLRFGSGGVEAGQGMPWVVVVTSQGIARFSDSLLGVARPGLTAKLGTAHGIVYVGYEEAWSCSAWNIPASGIAAVMASLQGKFSLECD